MNFFKRIFIQNRGLARSYHITSINRCKSNPVNLAYNSYENLDSRNEGTVVIMHGLFGSKQNWKSICKALHAKSNPKRKVRKCQIRQWISVPVYVDVSNGGITNDLTKRTYFKDFLCPFSTIIWPGRMFWWRNHVTIWVKGIKAPFVRTGDLKAKYALSFQNITWSCCICTDR